MQPALIDPKLARWFDRLPPTMQKQFMSGVARRAKNLAQRQEFVRWQADPVGFGERVLNEKYTPDIKRVMESVRDNPVTIARSGNATGKSQPVNTPVITPTGWVPIGSLRVGDMVFGADGRPTPVVGVFPQGWQPTYRVEFNDGTVTHCSADHLWAVRSSADKSTGRDWQVLPAVQIEKILHRFIHVPMPKPVAFPAKELRLDPYVMGALLGDGGLTNGVRLHSFDQFVVDKVAAAVVGQAEVKRYKNESWGITTPAGQPNPVLDTLRYYRVIGQSAVDKAAPAIYLQGSIDQRRALLAGLMDTDGYIDSRGSMSYTTASPRLAAQIQELVWSLGGTAKLKAKIPGYVYNGERRRGRPAYTVTIKLPFCPFTLPRRVERYRPENDMQKQAHRLIKRMEPAGERESVCIQVGNADGLYLTENYIVTHNTHAAARIAVWWYLSFPGSQVYTTAAPPERNLRQLLWGEIKQVVSRHTGLFENHHALKLAVEDPADPQHFLTGVSIPMNGTPEQREAKFSGKHAPYLLFIVDEGDAVPVEVYKAIESSMSGGLARLLIMFNPRGEQGVVYQRERDRQANVVELSALDHPNVRTGEDIIPGAVTRDKTVERFNKWTRALAPGEQPDSECIEVPGFLVGCTAPRDDGGVYPPLVGGWRKVTESSFWYMVLARYPAKGENQLISRAWLDAARSRWDAYVAQFGEQPPVGVRPVMGVDVADMGRDWNRLALRYGGWVAPILGWQGLDTDLTADRAAEYYQMYDVQQANVDGTGVGAGVAPKMGRHGCNAQKVMVASSPTYKTELGEFMQLRDQLWWSVRVWLERDPGAMLPPDEELIEDLAAPRYEIKNGKIKITDKERLKQQLGRSPDKGDALGLTFAPEIEFILGFA